MNNLTGSGKQIIWAEEIRDRLLNGRICQNTIIEKGIVQEISFKQSQIDSDIEELKTVTDTAEIVEIKEEIEMYKNELFLYSELKNKLESEESSKWFIDNRVLTNLLSKEIYNKR